MITTLLPGRWSVIIVQTFYSVTWCCLALTWCAWLRKWWGLVILISWTVCRKLGRILEAIIPVMMVNLEPGQLLSQDRIWLLHQIIAGPLQKIVTSVVYSTFLVSGTTARRSRDYQPFTSRLVVTINAVVCLSIKRYWGIGSEEVGRPPPAGQISKWPWC